MLAFALSAVPARAADEPLDTITVEAAGTSVVTGKVTLKAGTRYVIEVAGTMQSTGPEGYGYQYDALYCYAGVKFDHEECEDERRDPNNRTQRNANFVIGAGGGSGPKDDWRISDQFTTTSKPPSDTPAVGYDANHVYTVAFYPPADGPIRGAGSFALNPCPTCQNTTTGSFTIKIFATATAAPAPSPSPTTTPKPACAASSHFAVMSICNSCLKCYDIGDFILQNVPPPGTPIDMSVKLSDRVRQLFLDAGIEDADTQKIIATIIVRAKARALVDRLEGCLVFGGLERSDSTVWTNQSPKKSTLELACAKFVADQAEREAGRPLGRAAAKSGCQVYFYPAYARNKRPSAKRRRQIGKAAQKAFNGGCAQQGGKLTLAIKSARKGVGLAKLTGGSVSTKIVRVAKPGAVVGPKGRLYGKWRLP